MIVFSTHVQQAKGDDGVVDRCLIPSITLYSQLVLVPVQQKYPFRRQRRVQNAANSAVDHVNMGVSIINLTLFKLLFLQNRPSEHTQSYKYITFCFSYTDIV